MAFEQKAEIGFDKQKIRKEVEDVGKTISEGLTKGAEPAADLLEQMFSKSVLAGVDPQRLRGVLRENFTQLARDQQVRVGLERVAKTVASAVGSGITSKQVERSLQKAVGSFAGGARRGVGAGGDELLQDIEGGQIKTRQKRAAAMRAIGMAGWGAATGILPRGGFGIGNLPGNIGAYGAAGGAAVTAAQMAGGIFTGSVGMGKEQEALRLRLAPLKGNANLGLGRGFGAGFSMQEMGGMLEPLLRGGAGGGISGVMRAQRGFGMGGDLTQLLTGQAMRGGTVTSATSKEELRKVIASGMQTGLERGRWGEIARGMSDMIRGRGLGMGVSTTGVAGGLAQIGGRQGFRGVEAFEAVRGMEAFAQGGRTPLGRALALTQIGGLGGTAGSDIFAAERQMELGMFGERTFTGLQSAGGNVLKGGRAGGQRGGAGVEGFRRLLTGMKQQFMSDPELKMGKEIVAGGGVDEPTAARMEIQRGAALKEMAANMGITVGATEKLVNAFEEGNRDAKELKAIISAGKPLEEQAYKAMIGLADFKKMETSFDNALLKFWKDVLQDPVTKIVTALTDLANFFSSDEKTGAAGVGKIATKHFGPTQEDIESMKWHGRVRPKEPPAPVIEIHNTINTDERTDVGVETDVATQHAQSGRGASAATQGKHLSSGPKGARRIR